MDNGPMTNGDVDTDMYRLPRIAMEHSAILNIAPRSDADLFQITTSHCRRPEAAAPCHPDIANDNGGIGDPSISVDLRIGPRLRSSHYHGSAATSLSGDLSDNLTWCRKRHAQAGTGR